MRLLQALPVQQQQRMFQRQIQAVNKLQLKHQQHHNMRKHQQNLLSLKIFEIVISI
jgi:hypothetical protein